MNAFILHDRYFDPEPGHISSYFSKLFILAGQASLQYCILDTERSTFVAVADYRLPSSPKTPESFYAGISQLISQEEILQKKYPSVVIGLDTALHTLVPAPFYDTGLNGKYLEFNFGVAGNEQVCADKLEDLDAYNVYSVPQGMLDVFLRNYKEAAFFHRTSALIRAGFHNQKAFPGPASLYLNVREQFIDLLCFDSGRIAYFNSYSCLGIEDMLYYTLYTLEQLKLSPDSVQLYISGLLDAGSDSYRLLEQYVRKVSFTENPGSFNFSPLFTRQPSHRYLELFALALCGS